MHEVYAVSASTTVAKMDFNRDATDGARWAGQRRSAEMSTK